MFTLQANQIQSALRSQFGNTPTAQDMVQALCNCAQTIEHRGPAQFSFDSPSFGMLPPNAPLPGGLASPVRTTTSPPLQQTGPTYQIINFPPFQPLRWDQIPFVDIPESESFLPPAFSWVVNNTFAGTADGPAGGYPAGGVFGAAPQVFIDGTGGGGWWNGNTPFPNFFNPPPAMSIPGPLNTGPIQAGPLSSPQIVTNYTHNYGDGTVQGGFNVGGYTQHSGGMTVSRDTIHNGPVYNNDAVTNQDSITNEGPVTNQGDEHHYGGNTFHNSMTVVANGQPLQLQDLEVITAVGFDQLPNGDLRVSAQIRTVRVFAAGNGRFDTRVLAPNIQENLVTDVTWDDANKKFVKTRRDYSFFGRANAAAANANVFAAQNAKFDPNECKIVPDADAQPEYSPIAAP